MGLRQQGAVRPQAPDPLQPLLGGGLLPLQHALLHLPLSALDGAPRLLQAHLGVCNACGAQDGALHLLTDTHTCGAASMMPTAVPTACDELCSWCRVRLGWCSCKAMHLWRMCAKPAPAHGSLQVQPR